MPSMKEISESDLERFWSKVDKTGDCWVWTASTTYWGYGRFFLKFNGQKKVYHAHRVSYYLSKGNIPKGKMICHVCDNPPCVNPDHLFLGDELSNIQDSSRKGRMHPGEKNGASKLTRKQVDEIRKIYKKGEVGYLKLAKRFGVASSTIRKIIVRKMWA